MAGEFVVLEPVPAPERARRLVSAGSLPFRLAALDVPGSFEEVDAPLAATLRRWIAENEWLTVPVTGWRELASDGAFVLLGNGAPPDLVTVTFEYAAGAGSWEYWNSVHGGGVRAWRTGLEASSWRIDPLQELMPTSTRLHALVTEQTCASGQSAAGRVQAPELYADDDELVLTFYVTPLGGAQTCPENPETAVIVNLGQAVGDRHVRDGSVPTPMGPDVTG